MRFFCFQKGMRIETLYQLFLENPVISTDSRTVEKDSIFFALKGDRFNGNDFAQEAMNKGAVRAVVDEKKFAVNGHFIVVENVLSTLQELAAYHRNQLDIPILAITGSNGKTTTKELIRSILEKKYKVLATKGNLNNHIGVPLTLLSLKHDHQVGIIEMGANHQGEIMNLCRIADPELGLITNIGRAHLEGFGSEEVIRKAKGELYDYLGSKEGKVYVNNENNLLLQMLTDFRGKIIRYGKGKESSCTGVIERSYPYLQVRVQTGELNQEEVMINTRLVGDYNLENIMAAVCVGNDFGLDSTYLADSIENYTPDLLRSQFIQTDKNSLVADSYNANPSSMEAALQSFGADPHPDKILVLGEMKELGENVEPEHIRLVNMIRMLNFTRVFLIGNIFFSIQIPEDYKLFRDVDGIMKWPGISEIRNAKILIKGSRLMQLERLIQLF